MEYKYNCDIAVIGAGPSGIAAAVTAAEAGADVLLCEAAGQVGGMSTVGGLNVWCGKCSSVFFTGVLDACSEKRGQRMIYSPEKLEQHYLKRISDSGVRLLLHCCLFDADCEGGKVREVHLTCAGNTVTVTAGIFIDSTGNGDLAVLAGCLYDTGNDSGDFSPASLEFSVFGVNEETAVYPTFGTHPALEKKMAEYVADGRILGPAGHVILIEGRTSGTAYVNMTNFVVSGSDPVAPEMLTKAELTTRAQVEPVIRFLREYVPGFENCQLLRTAGMVGVRESRRIRGRDILTEFDIADGRDDPESVVRNVQCGLSGHHPSGTGSIRTALKAKPFSIPLGCCISSEYDNLLLNGRCISVTHDALNAVRLMPVCIAVGEGLGSYAADLSRRQ